MKKKNVDKVDPDAKKKKLVTIFLGFFIIMIMIGSALNMYKDEDTGFSTSEYQGVTFNLLENGNWVAYPNNKQVVISYSPEELENITALGLMSMNYFEKVYLSLDPNDNIINPMSYFMRQIQGQGIISSRLVPSCTVDVENQHPVSGKSCSDLPIKTCEDSSTEYGVIVFERSNESSVSLVDNCLTMKGDFEGLSKITDKLILVNLIG